MIRRSRPLVAILLLCAAQAIARKSPRRRLENDLGFEKKGRASRKEAMVRLHTFDEAWGIATTEQRVDQPEIDCIRRHDQGKGKRIGKSKAKKSKSSTYFCAENGGSTNEESALVSIPTLIPAPAPTVFPSPENIDIPSAESIPVSTSVVPSILEQVSPTSTPTFFSSTPFPSVENSVIPSGESSLAPSVPLFIDGPTAENAPTQVVPSVQVPVAFPSAPPDSAPVLYSSSPTNLLSEQSLPPSIEPSTQTMNENGDITSDNALVRICNSFLAGAAPTFGPKIQFQTKLILLLDGTVPTQRVLVQIHDILTYEVAPALLGCSSLSSGGSGRRAQVVVSGLRNLVFAVPTEDPAGE